MAYGLRYELNQKLRDNSNLTVSIYEDGYSGSSYTYVPTQISLTPNSSEEDPIGCIISSQLNVSFIVSTNDDYTNFPDLLSYNDVEYYVELSNNGVILWKGFLFNDYINVGFVTGYQEVNIVCIDGLSFLKDIAYQSNADINAPTDLLTIICESLLKIPYKNASSLYSCISYFAAGMFNRGVSTNNETFSQTYQYRRDYVTLDYYSILENIILSFGCRLFQYNGDFYIMPINDMATGLYYTKFTISSSPTVITSGTLSNAVSINAYAANNVHFINTSQVKIVRKGYPRVTTTFDYRSALNYIYNNDLKIYSGTAPAYTVPGWTFTKTVDGYATIDINSNYQYNGIFVASVFTAGSTGRAEMGTPGIYSTLPFMYGPEITLTFDYLTLNQTKRKIKVAFQLNYYDGSSYTIYYMNSSNIWSTSFSFFTVETAEQLVYESKSLTCFLGPNVVMGSNLDLKGYIRVIFLADDWDAGFGGGYIRNINLRQVDAEVKSEQVTRFIGTSKTTKDIDLPYGGLYPIGGAATYEHFNYIGTFTNSSGAYLTGWYRFGKAAESFRDLISLMIRQYSNLLNKNIATLEGDLGAFKAATGTLYLDKVYSVSDAGTSALNYNTKKFLINRLELVPYLNTTASIQLIEVTNADITSTEKLDYILNQTQTPQNNLPIA
jgi:hypothetical protein